MIDLRRILVPIDFSQHSQHALNYGIAFAEKFEAEMFLLHVFNDLAIYQPNEVTIAPPTLPPLAELTAGARQSLDRLIQEHLLERFRVHSEVREGSPVDEICLFAGEMNIDLIVMGTHGRGWLAHVLLGSVVEKVVRKASCPVLTVRLGEQQFVAPEG